MDKDYFDENKRQYDMSFNKGALMNNSRDLLLNQSETFKLSLRKKRLNNIITSKRMMNQARQNSKLEINLSSLDIPNLEINKTFESMNELYEFIKKNLHSKKIDEIKYGICLLKNFINSQIQRASKSVDIYNIDVISDIFEILDTYIETDIVITYELLNILINLTFIDANCKICKMCITPMSYRLWERICRTQNANLIANLIWLLGNMVCDNREIAYNVLTSNMLGNYILPFFEEEKFNMFSMEERNAFIERGIILFSKIIYNDDEKRNKNVYQVKKRIFLLFIEYYKYGNNLIAIAKSFSTTDDNIELYLDIIKHSELIQFLIKYNQPSIYYKLYTTRIIGNILSVTDMTEENEWAPGLEDEVILYLSENLSSVEAELVKQTVWCISNLASGPPKSTGKVIRSQKCILQVIKLVKEETNRAIIEEVFYLLSTLISCSTANDFFCLMEYRIFQLLVESAVRFENATSVLEIIFISLGECIQQGELISNQLEDNVIKKAFIELGGKDLLDKHLNSKNEKLSNIIHRIIEQYFKNDFEQDIQL